MTRTYVATLGILTTALTANHHRPVAAAAALLGAAAAITTAALVLGTAKCPSGCYCVRDRWVWRCVTCRHLCHHDQEVPA